MSLTTTLLLHDRKRLSVLLLKGSWFDSCLTCPWAPVLHGALRQRSWTWHTANSALHKTDENGRRRYLYLGWGGQSVAQSVCGDPAVETTTRWQLVWFFHLLQGCSSAHKQALCVSFSSPSSLNGRWLVALVLRLNPSNHIPGGFVDFGHKSTGHLAKSQNALPGYGWWSKIRARFMGCFCLGRTCRTCYTGRLSLFRGRSSCSSVCHQNGPAAPF